VTMEMIKRGRVENYGRENVNAKVKNEEDTGGRIRIHRENFTQNTILELSQKYHRLVMEYLILYTKNEDTFLSVLQRAAYSVELLLI